MSKANEVGVVSGGVSKKHGADPRELTRGGEVASYEVSGLLGKGTQFEGALLFDGVVRIEGEFRGKIFTRDTLVLGPESRVFADVEADTVVAGGFFEGSIRARDRVLLQKTGHIKGRVQTPNFPKEEGGIHEGESVMFVEESPLP